MKDKKYLPSSSLRHSISCIVLLYLSSIVNSVFSERKKYRMNQIILTDLSIENSQARIPKKTISNVPSFFFFPLPFFFFGGIFTAKTKPRLKICSKYLGVIWLLGRHLCFQEVDQQIQQHLQGSCAFEVLFYALSKMASLRVLVGCKRVIDYAVKVCDNCL